MGSSAGKDGSIFISSIQNGSSIAIEKFSHEGKFISKQESPLDIRKESKYKAVMRTDTCTNNAVILNLMVVNQEKDKAFSYFRFNFDNNQVAVTNEAPLNKKSPYPGDLEPIDIQFTKDNILMFREGRGTVDFTKVNGPSNLRYVGGTIIISVFDRQMKLQRDIVIKKETVSYNYRDIGLAIHMHKGKLFILTAETNSTLGNLGNYCYNINLNDGKFEKKKIGSHESLFSTSMFTPATMWLGNECIMTHLQVGIRIGFFKYTTILERIGYDTL